MRGATYEEVQHAAGVLGDRLDDLPTVAIVLGSGLGEFTDGLHDTTEVAYDAIPHWPATQVTGHSGTVVAGTCREHRIVALSGRAHYYEGHAMSVVTFGIRVLGALGVRTIILTNAAGGINTRYSTGTLMVIDDHINSMGTNPLVGVNDDRFGVRFPDMSEIYSHRLRAVADQAAESLSLPLEHGVYIGVHGPSYETPAEIRAFRAMGADAVGMSTVPEAIVARHMGMEVLGISCITNMAAGVLPQPLVHDEVMKTAGRVRGQFIALVEGIIERL